MSQDKQVEQENRKKNKVLSTYAELAKKLKRHVKMNDLVDAGITKDTVTHYFRSLTRLSQAAREQFPDNFHDVDVKTILGPKALKELQDAVKSHKRFVITTAVTGCPADENMVKSVSNYCKRNKASLLVLMSSDPAHNKEFARDYGSVDKKLLDAGANIVLADTALNSNLYISTIKLSAKHIDPLTGLSRIGQRNGSFIYASPKQRLKAIPVSNSKLPHVMMTTGAITKANYATENYMSERTAYIAENDHIMGGVILDIVDKDIYHYTQFQADTSGAIIDKGIQYNPDGSVENVAPSAFVLGDWHAGETDPNAKKAWIDVVKKLGVQTLVLHDAFSGVSINHHEDQQYLLKAQRADDKELSIEAELIQLAKDLDEWSNLVDEIVIVKSNHDEFLERYLQQGKYVKDPQNHRIALKLALAMLDGKDPLRYGIEMAGLKTNKVRWLKRDEDYKVARIQLGAHGDVGANGARGSLASMEAAYGSSVSGHSHTPEILRGAWQVGTSSYLKLSYNRGPSSWMHTSCLVYHNGAKQLINVINGKWRI